MTQAERRIDFALYNLRVAREQLRQAGCPKTLARVRSAISSIYGARRHAHLAPFRETRQRAKAIARDVIQKAGL